MPFVKNKDIAKNLFNNSDYKNWINKFSNEYYYYYIKDDCKIPILNAILYLESAELLSIFLILIELAGCKLVFSRDQFGFNPFEIA